MSIIVFLLSVLCNLFFILLFKYRIVSNEVAVPAAWAQTMLSYLMAANNIFTVVRPALITVKILDSGEAIIHF